LTYLYIDAVFREDIMGRDRRKTPEGVIRRTFLFYRFTY